MREHRPVGAHLGGDRECLGAARVALARRHGGVLIAKGGLMY